ncbi:MAG TPA: AtpZ/AtpI family protein [Planctomycetota bacterium]|nr:AtpZ/AtpI family protein [Planctomycetota bacterium]
MGENDDRRGLQQGLRFVGVGFSFAALAAAGWYGGRWVGERFGIEPWGSTVGVLLGIAVAIWDLLRVVSALDREEAKRK